MTPPPRRGFMKVYFFFGAIFWGIYNKKNNIRDVGSTADLVLVLLVHLVHWYLVHGLIGTYGALVPGTLVPTVT